MKTKLSISIEARTSAQLEALVSDGRFRNKSHAIEFALNKFIQEDRR